MRALTDQVVPAAAVSDPWASLVGHAPVIARLRRGRADGTLPHALLLVGAEGTGKTSIAEALAEEVLDGAGWPGGLAAHPDHWLEDSAAERIGIDRVRAGGGTPESGPSLQDFFALRPYAGGERVAVLGRADRLTEPAADCILKTLEEPPPGTHIVLCAAHPERLPATIASRCQQLALAPVPADEVDAWLRARGVEERRARLAAALGGGRPGRALALASAPGALRAEIEAIDALLTSAGSGRSGAMRTAALLAPPSTAEGRERALSQVAAWTGFLRDVACVAAGAPELCVWEEYGAAAAGWAQTLPARQLTALLMRCIDAADALAQYAVPRLCFEVLLLDILAAGTAPPRFLPPVHDPELLGPEGDPTPTISRPRPRSRGRR